uniref:Testicular haploid expressed gene protein isoform X2 n=1 Tax=Phascolarctos cinereus TaxID=38626 RepID=A0A6P5M1R2_PHACI|nr:testicular haploid expressed gene protein isoform X2 [Phascolarctos cinereus]
MMKGIDPDNLSNLPCRGSLVEDFPLDDDLPLDDGITATEREIISRPWTEDDEMPDVIVTELRSWKKCHQRCSSGHHRKSRIDELAKPKVNHQIIIDRPSVYWTDKIQPDTTLSVTFPLVTPRLEELSRPKRFYSTYYNESRSTPIWPISRASLEAKASPRLKVLAYPKIRNNIWVIDSSVIQVSKAAQLAQARPRTLELAAPRNKTVSSTELYIAQKMPKMLATNYTYDKPCSWVISDGTKNAMASKRILYLAKPKERKDCNEGHDPYCISVAALRAEPSPRVYELAIPKRVATKI